ncbi:MAG TPA: cytochrome d ubiquinol oxidase subunit II, partial [Mycobacterium sp.]|nr:cytochrome d ubiquinol oxidase subunit II [Mycobacterium sp.]
MTLAAVVAMAMFLGVVVYALFAGADFGSGFYDLTAGFGSKGDELRTLIDTSIGPVWEANHVWLIYILVMWWTGFPATFAAATTTLFIPLSLALVGIVLRGASFAFRKYSETFAQARLYGAIFASSSVITPFFLGAAAGAIASGRVPAQGYGDLIDSWVNPTSLVGGCLAVVTCIFLAGVFLTADAERAGQVSLAESLRTRTLAVGIATGVVVFAGLYPVAHDAHTLSHGLRTAASPLLVIAAIAGVATIVLLYRRRYSIARIPAAAAVTSVVAGWGV